MEMKMKRGMEKEKKGRKGKGYRDREKGRKGKG